MFILSVFIIAGNTNIQQTRAESRTNKVTRKNCFMSSRLIFLLNNSRLSHLFRLVPNLFWVIVEDAEETSILVRNLINRSKLTHRSVLLYAKTPTDHKLTNKVR